MILKDMCMRYGGGREGPGKSMCVWDQFVFSRLNGNFTGPVSSENYKDILMAPAKLYLSQLLSQLQFVFTEYAKW